MRYRPLGSSGLIVSVAGLGCNNFGRRVDLDGTRAVVDAALAEGVNFFDTADIYGRGASEELLGQVLGDRRREIVLATKFGMDMGDGKGPRGSRDYILQAFEASLRRLRKSKRCTSVHLTGAPKRVLGAARLIGPSAPRAGA